MSVFLRLIPAHAGKTIDAAPARLVSAAHPRSRGENRRYQNLVPGFPGSSPLTRGKHSRRRRHLLDGGLIPAHAGKTRPCRGSGTGVWAHPRSRGENA